MIRHARPDLARIITALSTAAAAVLAASACSDGNGTNADPSVARDSAGIQIVENANADSVLDARVVEVAALIPPDSALTAVPWGIAATADGIAVLDWTGTRVVTFDASGTYLGSFGRKGDGPGEFRNPAAIAVDANEVFTVWDAGRGVLSRWSTDGGLLDEQRAPMSYWGPGFRLSNDGLLTVTNNTSGMTMAQSLVAHRGEETSTLHVVPVELTMMDLPCAQMPAPRVFAPSIVWTSLGDTVFVLNGPAYRIDVFTGTTPVGSIRREVPPIPATTELAITGVESGPGPYGEFLRRCNVTARQLTAAVGHEPFVSPVQSMVLDPAGHLWVARTTDGVSPSRLDVFAPGGTYLASIQSDVVPAAFVTDSTFAGVRMTEYGLSLALYVLRPHDLIEGTPALQSIGAGAGWRRLIDSGPAKPRGGSGVDANPSTGSGLVLPYNVLELPHFRDCDSCPVMIELPPGAFVMGAAPGEAPAAGDATRPLRAEVAERPQVEVQIAESFAIGKYEVTFTQWDACVAAGGCEHRADDNGHGRGDRPVRNIARRDAEQYVAWLSRETERPYRLPSEAEWEYAARAGTTTARYWGDAPDGRMVACDGCGSGRRERSAQPVGSFPPNPWGLHDMLGNVSEWVADCWHPTHEGARSDGSARVETSPAWRDGACELPMYRGGTYSSYVWATRSAWRWYRHPGPWPEREGTTGLRVALTLERT